MMASLTVDAPSEVTQLSATEVARLIAGRRLSAVEAVDAYIRRAEQVNPLLNALVVPLFDEARRQAAAADAHLTRGHQVGPLHGVPITIKECLDVQGTPTTWGLVHKAHERVQADDPLVDRLRLAGAIIIGKTNVAELLLGCESDNPLYGRTVNPWNPDRSPGGSSGGEAAILAAGGSALGIGTDIGGSVRTPAHFCGIHALKPTSGRLMIAPPRGIYHIVREAAVMAQPGPMARHVADLTLAMQVLTEGDVRRPVQPELVSLKGLRIGVYTDDGLLPAAPAVRRTVHEAAEALCRRGAVVEPFDPVISREAYRLYLSLVATDGGDGLRRTLGRGEVPPSIRNVLRGQSLSDGLRPMVSALMRLAGQDLLAQYPVANIRRRSPEELRGLAVAREALERRMADLLDAARLDALLCPPMAFPAVPHGSFGRLCGIEAGYAMLFNVTGLPAGVVSLSRVRPGEESDRRWSRDQVVRTARAAEEGSAGLPVGVQVAARYWREDVVLAVMAALEEDFRGRPDCPVTPVVPHGPAGWSSR